MLIFSAGKRSGFDAGISFRTLEIILNDPFIFLVLFILTLFILLIDREPDLRIRARQNAHCRSLFRLDPHTVKYKTCISGNLDPVCRIIDGGTGLHRDRSPVNVESSVLISEIIGGFRLDKQGTCFCLNGFRRFFCRFSRFYAAARCGYKNQDCSYNACDPS